MTTPSDFDVGPLTWVKGEIDAALAKAREQLTLFAGHPADTSPLKFAQTHLHQVKGAIQMVGLDGLARFCEEVEHLLSALEKRELEATGDRLDLADLGLGTLGKYLDDLMVGEPDIPLRLSPTYKALLEARGVERISESDLFFPDLGVRAPKASSAPPVPENEMPRYVRAQRTRYQKGLLGWLRNAGDAEGLRQMRSALESIEATQTQPVNRTFWWDAVGFIDALLEGDVPPSFNVKSLCGRIDQQIRRLGDKSTKVAERLMRDVLYYIASARPATERLGSVKSAYELDAYLPPPTPLVPADEEVARIKPIVRELLDALSAAKDAWLKFTAGNKDALKNFQAQAKKLAERARALDHQALQGLLDGIAEAAARITAGAPSSETVDMEMATALLLSENAVENLDKLSPAFVGQAHVQGRRLAAALAGESLADIEQLPMIDEMSRRAQEKLLLAQVGTEIQTNLRHVEQVLDAFFRDHTKRADIPGLAPYITQIQGALRILELERAAELLMACQDMINKFADPEYQPEQADLELVAEGLSSLGFYVDAVQHGKSDAFEILAPVIKRFPSLKQRQETLPEEIPVEAEEVIEVPVASVEEGLDDLKKSAHTLYEQWKADASDENRDKVLAQVSTLQQDADLIDDVALKEQASRVLALFEAGGGATPELDAAVAGLAAPKVAAVAPSQETARLLEASAETIDREMLEVYLEEAQEVLASVREHLAMVRSRPDDKGALTTIRRGFHTLKGSGRMVGLTDLGEVAWAVEQTMNKWLQDERDATPELVDMLQLAHDCFVGWVSALSGEGHVVVEASELLARAEALRAEPKLEEAAPELILTAAPEATEVPGEAFTLDFGVSEAEVLPELAAEAGLGEEVPEEIVFDLPAIEGEETIEAPGGETELVPSEEEIVLEAVSPIEEPALPEGEAAEPGRAEPVTAEPAALSEVNVGETAVPAALYELFLEEAAQHLATLEDKLQALAAQPAGSVEYDFMRAAHTLCGISSTVGFTAPADLSYELEQALVDLLEHPRPVDERELGTMRAAVDALRDMVSAIERHEAPPSASGIIEELRSQLEAVRAARAQLAAEPEPPPAVMETELVPVEPVAVEPAVVEPPIIEPAPQPLVEAVAQPVETPLPPAYSAETEAGIRDDLDDELLPVFLEEAQELMPFIGNHLRTWRVDPTDEAVQQALQRGLHTLKGSARMAGAMRLGEMTHQLETRVLAAMEGGPMTAALFDDLDAHFDRIGDLHEALVRGEVAPPAALPAGLPPMAAPAPAATVPRAQPQVAAPTAFGELEQAAARALLRVRADVVDRLVNEAGEVSIARSRIEGEMLAFKQSLKELTDNVIRLRGQLREVEIQAESQMQSRLSAAQDQLQEFDPLEFDRFTRLQELTRMMAESVNDVSTIQQTLLKNIDEAEAALLAQSRMNRELQQQLMHIRMVPLSSITERLHRIVRQTAKELDKKVALQIQGENVELDRSVLEKMTAPFEHLLRNAVVHGLESEQDREIAGKPETGEIKLVARQEGNEIVLVVSDDGAGIDLDRVRAKALELGMIQADEEMAPARLIEMIFQPGFSTAAEVTQVAGRGVGMDVVRNEIAGLGGRIEVSAEKGKGTTFTIYLPLTLAVTQAVMVHAGGNVFALPSSMVEQVQEVRPDALAEIYRKGEVEWLGNRYPLHYLPRLLADNESQPEAKSYTSLMLLKSGTQRCAIHVDALEGNQEIVVKNVGPQLARVTGISGATVLGNGRIVLIINPVQLAHREAPHVGAQVTAPVKEELVTTPLIMVVDDSLTVRKITGRLLSKEGYQVITAKDGVDALQQLQETLPAVMLVDIEMPRMDGFELTKNVRSDERTKHIPIIMITSRTAEKHRNYAKELGVNVYLGKPYQEEELLAHIAQFVQQGVKAAVPA
jgi:chemosensory pili system protein ChpA (sensor histidine kinase/response regulator)